MRLARRRPDAGGRGRGAAVTDLRDPGGASHRALAGRGRRRRWPTGFARLAGAEMVGGLTRRGRRAARRRRRRLAGRRRHHRGRAAGPAGRADAAGAWPSGRRRATRSSAGQLDTTGWVDLPDSCFTYSAAGPRAVRHPHGGHARCVPDLYSPRPGQARVFERRKVARAGARRRAAAPVPLDARQRARLRDHATRSTWPAARIVRAEHVTPRLPYAGICSEPQRRITALLGETRRRRAAQAHPEHPRRRGRLRPALRPDRRSAEAAGLAGAAPVVGRSRASRGERVYYAARCRSCPSASSPRDRCRPSSTSTPSQRSARRRGAARRRGRRRHRPGRPLPGGDRPIPITFATDDARAGTRCRSTPTTSLVRGARAALVPRHAAAARGPHRRGRRARAVRPARRGVRGAGGRARRRPHRDHPRPRPADRGRHHAGRGRQGQARDDRRRPGRRRDRA